MCAFLTSFHLVPWALFFRCSTVFGENNTEPKYMQCDCSLTPKFKNHGSRFLQQNEMEDEAQLTVVAFEHWEEKLLSGQVSKIWMPHFAPERRQSTQCFEYKTTPSQLSSFPLDNCAPWNKSRICWFLRRWGKPKNIFGKVEAKLFKVT